MSEQKPKCEKCKDTGVVDRVENGTVEVPCDCLAGEQLAQNQGMGIEPIFGWLAAIGVAFGFAGYFLPPLILQIWTVILLVPAIWFVVAHAIDKPQTLVSVIPLTAVLLILLLGPMWLVYFFFR